MEIGPGLASLPVFVADWADGANLSTPPALIEKLPLAIYACDAEGRLLWFNSLAAKLWGRTPLLHDDSEKYCGSYRLYFGGQPIAREETPMASVLRTGIPVSGAEGRVERPDGTSIWAMVHIEPVRDGDGRLIGAINCFHETTALHPETSDLEDFLESSAIGLRLVSGNGTILRANQAELAMLGYAAEDYVGRNIRDFHLDQAVADDFLGRLANRERIDQFPARLRAGDGSVMHVLITANTRAGDREAANTLCLTVDVTERVRSGELLREQDRRLAVTYEHAGSGISEVDADGKMLRVNARLCGLMGRSADELLGRSIFEETFSEDIAADREQFRRQVAGEIDRYTIEKRIPRKDGGLFWASVTSSSVRDGNGGFLYAVRVQHDISERKQVQHALVRKAEEQAALHEFTERLQPARSLGDIYVPALDAIVRALRCQRASILLFDQTGSMKFVAWRGLSDGYRSAVEGHSPWSPDAEDPQPICLADIGQADLPASLAQTISREGIAAIAFIPIVEDERLLGKFMAYYDEPHDFSGAEVDVARTLARQLGLGIERIRAQKATQQLVSIVESSHDAIVSKDLDGVIMTWNRGAERVFGYTADEAIGKSILILIPPDRRDEEPGILARIRNGEVVDHFETVRRRKDGSLVDISLTISPVRDAKGRIVGASKIARDITERKEAEAKIRDSERRLQDLLTAIPAAIYTTDAEGRIAYFNQAAVDLAGRTPTIGSDEWCVTWKLYNPDGTPLPHDQCPMAVSLREGRPVRGAEAVAERPDGSRVPFIAYPTPMYDANGKLVGGINMLVDVSERKQAETQQRILLNELNHRVKNNMQMLQSMLSAAGRRSPNAEAQEILKEASSRITAMAAAQRVLYDTPNAIQFSAPQFLSAVCETAQQTFPPHVRIVCDAAAADLPNDFAMPLALIVNELLTNAVKHGLNGHAQSTVRVGFSRDGEANVLFVEDEGPGFDLDAVRQRSSGLRLVEGLARQLRGRFTVSRGAATRCSLTFS
ncbi:PAS domain S-box protein [Mesorhizobium sp. LHD-90]|uniref:PAS domain S-box protein n=1 Tax=Mesorhizobium sp. LHD-90 TaxID=3071414 RepID=UPI0027E04CEC|nr:PAS domain S-box protein [Mesorhizobium sp. LHD-90]MDQ6438318.1 PAS domain S-box protein [Mesorhizobium sp. LHD-90]